MELLAGLNRNEEVTDQNVVSPASGAPVFPETSKNKQSLDQMVLDQQIKIIAAPRQSTAGTPLWRSGCSRRRGHDPGVQRLVRRKVRMFRP